MSTDKFEQHNSQGSIIKSSSILASGTLLSRILGFLRDMILAQMLGTGFRADAFFVAFRIPNLLRDLVGEGASNSAVVPVLMEYQAKKEIKEFWQVVSSILILALMGLSVMTVVGVFLAPVIVRVIAPGFLADPQKLKLSIQLTQIMFPYLVLIGLTAHTMAILYTFRSFLTPAFGPCLLNLAMIISALLAPHFFKEPVYGLALGVLLGGTLQLLFQTFPLFRQRPMWQIPRPLVHPGAVRIGKLLVPRMMGTAVYELNLIVDTFCASLFFLVGLGGISAIYYSNRIVQFPMGIVGFSLSSASLPALSSLAAHKDYESFKKTVLFALENIFFLMAPAAVVMLVLGEPIIRILFQRGQFDTYSTTITSYALFYYALGLLSFGGIKIMSTAFYALQDTKTPVKITAACLGLTIVLNFLLAIPMKIGGIALASSITATVNLSLLLWQMEKRIGAFRRELKDFLFKILTASLLTALILYFAWHNITWKHEAIKFFLLAPAACVVYVVLCAYLRVEHAVKIVKWIGKRRA